tara:strand:- start:2509 stop:3471 length:963 start_codon:yes stop_codon:yes gene_type:complete
MLHRFKPIDNNDIILVTGANGMVGSAIIRCLSQKNYKKILKPTSSELDLRKQNDVESFLERHKPNYIFNCAGKVGGINANNNYKAEFLYDNLAIQTNLIHGAYKSNIKNLMNFGSSCIYPKECKQPMKEVYLLSGELEETNEGYAIAKIAGVKMCEKYNYQYNCNFMSVLPTNLYGPNDNYDLEDSHVLPALIHKTYLAKKNNEKFLNLWGDGQARREFMHVDDLAEACIFLAEKAHSFERVNIGVGKDITINELALKIMKILGYKGEIQYNSTMSNGTPQKLLDISILSSLGWKAKIELKNGLKKVIQNFKNEISYNTL